jgi:glycosyltransferase involved in cell wall biosynthesis
MASSQTVYLCVWTGNAETARDLVSSYYPGADIIEFSHLRFRSSSFKERLRMLSRSRGKALVFYFRSLADSAYIELLKYIHFLHGCTETVLADEKNQWLSINRNSLLKLIPTFIWAVIHDASILLYWWIYLHWLLRNAGAVDKQVQDTDLDIVYLLPNSSDMGTTGGAMSHIRGFLSGVRALKKKCRVFCGIPLSQESFRNEVVPPRGQRLLFWEPSALAFNNAFIKGVRKQLGSSRPKAFYQRHRRLSVAGAVLSRIMGVPLILEYNGSEIWVADHWDPTSFPNWIALCEEVSIRSATRLIVVSDVLKQDLIKRGIQEERIIVNPNGVDPEIFYPGCGEDIGRRELEVYPNEILVGFVGTFSLWHGIDVLQQAIIQILTEHSHLPLKFVLIGEGILRDGMRTHLKKWESTRQIVFTGTLPHHKVAEYLDAADILVSPHIPMPDGSPFFGSPTKLFEYMAMGKAIVASRLDQIAKVLDHKRTAWLVTPGNVGELVEGILLLASDPGLRKELGMAARSVAVQCYSWKHNAELALQGI